MLDLLLTHAYFLAEDPHEQQLMRPFPPLGIQYLVAWIRRAEVASVDWWDATFAPGPEVFADVLARHDPRVVGFYGHTVTRPVAAGMVARCVAQGRRVIAGGPDPVQSLDAWFAMGVEVVVIGEGERTLQALMEHLRDNAWCWNGATLAGIEGIAFLEDGVVVRTAPRALIRPIDQLPWPDRRREDLDAYFQAWRARHGETAMSVSTSRGCPFHCSWCSKQVYGDTFRRRAVEDVIDEILSIRAEFAPDQIWFVDDMFTLNRTWVDRFCRRMVERSAVTPFYVIGRAETLDAELVASLRRAGCIRMFLSAESGADHVLDAMEKGTTVAEIVRAADLLHAGGIELGVFVMLGYPGEEKRDILATRDMLRRVRPEVTLLSVAHPMKGTRFYDEVAGRITGVKGGRLTFAMRHSGRLYEVAQRMIWADGRLREKLDRRELDRELLGLAARYPIWRSAFALLS